MSSSSSAPARRVLRAVDAAAPDGVLGLDLRPEGLRRLDPRRVDAAVAEGRAAGYEAGYQAGLAEGRAAAETRSAALLAATSRRLDDLVAAVAAALAGAEQHHRASLEALADRATEVAFAVAEAVVGRELELAAAPGRDAVARALAAAPPGDTELVVHLHPSDAEAVAAAPVTGARPITIVPDETLAPGDCTARVGTTTVDARIGAALDRVRTVLAGGRS